MHDDLGLYVLGALDDAREFEAHLATCAPCQRELELMRGSLRVLDRHAADVAPPPDLRARTLAAAGITPQTAVPIVHAGEPSGAAPVIPLRQRLAARRWTPIAAIAAVALVAAVLGFQVFGSDDFSADRTVALAAVDGGAARGTARIDDTPSGQVIELTVSGLPDAATGMYYECWWVGEGDGDDVQNRVSAGTFRSGNGTYRMQSSADPARFPKMGVTLEPDDGNPLRTGQKVLVSGDPSGNAPSPAASVGPAVSP